MRAVIYSRVSTQDQTNENQEDRLRDYCKAKEWQVVKEYSDVISGMKDRRPGLDQLLQDARENKFDVVVSVKLDRLGRSLKHLVLLLDELHHFNVDIAFVDQPIDTTSSMGRLVFEILGAIANFERELIRERTIAGQDRARRQGKIIERPKKDLSERDRKNLSDLREKELSYNEIATRTRIPKGTVYNALNPRSITPPSKKGEIHAGNEPGHKTEV